MNPHQESVATRHDLIVQFCSEINNPKTVNELAILTGVGYHTIRNDIKELMDTRRVRSSGLFRDKSARYEAGSETLELHLTRSDRTKMSGTEFLKGWRGTNFKRTVASRAAEVLPVRILFWYQEVSNLKDGMTVEQATLDKLNKQLQDELKVVQQTVAYYKEFLGGKFWILDDLARIAVGDAIDTSLIQSIVQDYVNKQNSTAVETNEGIKDLPTTSDG